MMNYEPSPLKVAVALKRDGSKPLPLQTTYAMDTTDVRHLIHQSKTLCNSECGDTGMVPG